MKQLLILLFMLWLASSCSSLKKWSKETFEPKSKMDEVHKYHRPLEKQRLIPRPGYEGSLTNRVCTKWYGSKCEAESIREYTFKDKIIKGKAVKGKTVRAKLIKLQFACHIGGKRYRVCPDKEGFCRREKHTKCAKWGKKLFSREKICRKWKDIVVKKFLSMKDYSFLLDAGTECKKGY